MVKIRLRRMGAKKRPFYRIVVADSRTARNGRFIEAIGHYDPTQDPPAIKLEKDRAEHWLSVGARPSDVMRGLLKKEGLLGGIAAPVEPEEEPKAKPRKRTKAVKAAEAAAKETPAAEAAAEEPAPEAAPEAAEEPAPEPEAKEESE